GQMCWGAGDLNFRFLNSCRFGSRATVASTFPFLTYLALGAPFAPAVALATLAARPFTGTSALGGAGCGNFLGRFCEGRSLACTSEPVDQAAEQAWLCGGSGFGLGLFRCGLMDGRGLGVSDALDQGFRTRLGVLHTGRRPGGGLFGFGDQIEARFVVVQTRVVVTQAFDVMMGRF